MTDAELREYFTDIVAELRELRRLVEHPSTQDGAARLYLALAEHLDSDDPCFDREEPFEWARHDAELTAALEALGLHTPKALGYFLRDRVGRDIAGFTVLRDGRCWRLALCCR